MMDILNDIIATRSNSSTTSTFTSLGVPVGGCVISEHTTILEEGLRVCPLCQSELKLFVINYVADKALICENVECDYPFYEDDLPIFTAGSDMSSLSKYAGSKKTLNEASATCSIASSSWSDVERITRALDSDYTPSEYRLKNHKKDMAQREKVQKLLKNMDYVKNLTNQMKEVNKIGCKRRITNNKYIKNLMSLQTMTGAKILEPEELKVVKKDTNIAQVKVNVNTDPENSVSCIQIELVDITNEEKSRAEEAVNINTT